MDMNITILQRNIANCILAGIGLFCLPAFAGPVEDIHQVEERRYKAMMDRDADALANTLADEFL
jgi:hypothetical protein